MIFVVGIPGAGKTRAVNESIANGYLVYDPLLSGKGKLDKVLNLANDGREIVVMTINADPREAFTGTINRGIKTGSFVPIPYMLGAANHYETIYQHLKENYGNSLDILNFVRKGNYYYEEWDNPTEIDYTTSIEELYEVYRNHPKFNELSDEQKARIEGTAAKETILSPEVDGIVEGNSRGSLKANEGSQR